MTLGSEVSKGRYILGIVHARLALACHDPKT
jgi:hypothetical protein